MQSDNDPEQKHSETTLNDVKQLGTWAALGSLSYVFWVVGGMEMIERLAYYGVRSVATIYATRSEAEGGLGVTMAKFGTLLFAWNLLQSLVPIFTGGLSDRFGYKQTIFISTIVKCFGYLLMAWYPNYDGFFAGALCLAVGTAIFKPGIQGTLILSTSRMNSSMAWGVFYQTVNIGAWIGPLIALQMRHMSWTYVFYTNAAFICLNFILLLTYKEPGKEERLARRARDAAERSKKVNPVAASSKGLPHRLWERLKVFSMGLRSFVMEHFRELAKPHLFLYLLIFSVWWFMFPMLWDVLPKFIDDWVDTSVIVHALFGENPDPSVFFRFVMGMNEEGTGIEPEGIVNINAGIIMFTCFIFAGLSARIRATTSLLVGTILVVAALTLFGFYNVAWVCVGAMVIFSIGEMLASPKYSEFLGNIAPPDKKAMWIGFSQAPIMLGSSIEGKVGPSLYYKFSDKDVFSRDMLVEQGMDRPSADSIPVGEAFNKLVEVTGESPEVLTRMLYEANNIGYTWYFFAVVGVVSAIMIYSYGVWIKQLAKKEG